MLLILLAAALAAPPDPAAWKFVDETTFAGRSVLTFRTVELADAPTRPLHAADKPPAGAKFGSAGLGPGGRQRLGVVWHAGTSTLWFDADGDGRFAPAERHTLAEKPIETKVAISFGDAGTQTRTVLIRKRGEGVAWAVRGYTVGTVTVGGKPVAAALTDGDGDGCFDSPGADRVWLDWDGDGKFDPLTEQFPLGNAISAGGTALLVRPRPDGLGARVRERPSETGTLRVLVPRLPKSEVVELSANYVSEFGELVVVRAEDKPQKLPTGKYRVDSVQLALSDVDGKVWRYTFSSGARTHDVEISKGKETVHRLLGDPKVTVSFDAGTGVAAGESFVVQADVVASGLYLTKCEVATKFSEYGREVCAEIKLTEPGSVTLDRCESGFH
ncbi:hypothetical protein [Frigoriglobus tundricola]|uniref:Uncharacterized protein n=1 Tax=Frigoriglobus tundricola TaxID=2774151 RepID=A0A6M5Z0Q9_9BACT|nr:hypothetical protein [Frigoriglobus tundricola]QJW99977.1 hypothetical protein FTUN_7600 [Frigoriglobus tundricola]